MDNSLTTRSETFVDRHGAGPSLLVFAAGLWVLTRVIVWLPLGFLGTFINGLIWPFIVLSVLVGAVMTWRRNRKR